MHDPREAPVAAAYADLVSARSNPIPLGAPVLFAMLAATGLAVVTGAVRAYWLLPFAVGILVRPIQRRMLARARAAAAANRELARATGVHEPEPPSRTPAWSGLTSWGVAAAIVVLFGFHFGVRELIGSEPPPPLPEAAAEPAPVENVAWYGFAGKRCAAASTAIDRLARGDARAFRAKRYEIRSRAVDEILEGAGAYPDRANGALVHLNRALRHEEKAIALERARGPAAAEWSKADQEARISARLFEDLGVRQCAAVFDGAAQRTGHAPGVIDLYPAVSYEAVWLVLGIPPSTPSATARSRSTRRSPTARPSCAS